MLSFRRALSAALAAALFVLASAVSFAQANHLIISQLYGGGGNSGSVYSNDFVELYNPTSAAVDLSAYSLQYASSTGTFSASNLLQLAGMAQPGKYFLVKLAPGASTPQALPAPDFDPSAAPYNSTAPYNVLNLSGTGGKIALVPNTTVLSGACPAASTYTDFVGWGTTANCSYGDSTGANRAPATANGTGLILNSSNTWTGVNRNDYTVATPTPRNSTYTSAPVSVLSITSTALNPAAVMQGGATVLSVVVSPGSTTSNIAVSANLTGVGGSATQALALTGTNTYSVSLTVPATTAPNTYPITVTVTSSDPTVTGSANLSVTAATVTTPIATLQANRATYVGTTVQFQGVVTVVTSSGYYLQTPSSTPGSTGDEGIYVYGRVPATVAVGNLVTVNGTLTLYPLPTASHTPSLEVTSASVTSNGTAAVPAPIALPANFPTPGGGIYQLTRYESMLVTFPSLTVTGPTDGNLTENTETEVSTGQFYAVATGTPRPFREPGIDFRDFPLSTCPTVTNCTSTATAAGVARPANAVLFDDNPERIIVESSLGGGTALNLSSGAVIPGATGVVDFSYSTDSPYGDPARLIVQPNGISTANVTPGISVQPLAVPGAGQVTIAAYNIERFYNTNAADNLYNNPATNTVSTSQAATLTAAAYARRLTKLSLGIRTVLNTPDVVALEEVENKSVAQDIANQIDADATAAGQTPPHYVAYGTDNATTYTNDGTGISVGFLVKPATVDVLNWQQIGAASTFTASTGVQTLNDRPSQVLRVGFKRPNGASDYLMTLVVNHLRSLSGINTSADTRLKKELQAEALATAIQAYQSNGERVLSMGDYNAFEFSDGYTDTLGTATGRVSPAGTAAQPGVAILNPPATDLATLLPAPQRQSYTEYGNAQILDHIEATSNVVAQTQLAYAHLDADFPLTSYNDATTPARTSDHDAALAYLSVPAPVVSGTLTGSGTFGTVTVGSSSGGQQFVLTNTGEAPIAIASIATTGDFSQSNTCGASLAVGSTCVINAVFRPTVNGARTGTLTVSANASGIAPATLTGTGFVPATFTFTSGGSTATSVTVQHGYAVQVPLTLTPTTTFSGTVTLSCTGLPANTSCDFGGGAGVAGTLNITAGASAQSVTLLLRTSTLNAGVTAPDLNLTPATAPRIALAFCLPGLLLAGLGFRGRRLHGNTLLLLGLLLLSLAGTLGLTGCGSNKVANTTNTTAASPGTATINVVATGGGITQTVPVTLTIQ